jgi:hypothetical protein
MSPVGVYASPFRVTRFPFWSNLKGDITQKTETVKRYSDVLENPLSELDDQIKEIEKLLESEKFKSSEQSEHRDILVNTLEVLHELQRNGLEFFLDKLDPVRSDFHAHLEKNPSSVVSKELNRIYSSLEKYVSNIEMHSKLQLSLYEQYEEAQSLEVGKKIEVLKEVLGYNNLMLISYKWICAVHKYCGLSPFFKFRLRLLSHLNVPLCNQFIMFCPFAYLRISP